MKAISTTYQQEPHCCASIDVTPRLTVRIEDGGAGEFVVLNAVEWSFDDEAGIEALTAVLRDALGRCEEFTQK